MSRIRMMRVDRKSLNYINKKQIGFDKQKALVFVDILKKHNAYILGGDVLELKNEELRYTYDNWHCNPGEDDINKSYIKAKDYISKYPLEDRFFSFVWDDVKNS